MAKVLPQTSLSPRDGSPRQTLSSETSISGESAARRTVFPPFPVGTIQKIFGIDLRALAALRIGTGILLLVDLCQRVGDLSAFYSDAGTMPRSLLLERVTDSPWCISFHLMSGQPAVELALLVAAAVCGSALILGVRTRLFTILSWVFLLSLQYRNPVILQGGDVLLRLLVFWGIFLPWGERLSVEGTHSSGERARTLVSAAAAALLLQICFVYWFSACLKTDPSWRRDFTAIDAAFRLDHFAEPLAKLLLPYHHLLRLLTASSFWLEAVGPVIALLGGIVAWRVRVAAVFAFIAFHALMACSLELGLFPAICSVAWLVFLPAPFWDWAEKRLRAAYPTRAIATLSFQGHSEPEARKLRGRPQAIVGWLLSPRLGVRGRPAPAAIGNTLAGFFLVYVFLWNLRTTDHRRFDRYLPPSMEWIGWISGTAQVWDMFSPGPLMEGGWFVMPAQLANGKEVDIFRNGAGVSWEKPALVSSMYKNDRWRKYMVLIAAASNTDLRPPLGRYLSSQWNATHPKEEQIATLRIILMEQDTLPEKGYTNPRPILLWSGE